MDKKEAAKVLGVSVRRVEDLDTRNKLGEKRYVRGPTGKRRDYDPEAVERLKAELEGVDTALAPAPRQPSPAALAVAEQIAAGLERQHEDTERLGGLLEAIGRRLAERDGRERLADVAAKLMLTLADCAALSSLSEHHLRGAIRAGRLKGKIVGRGYKVKRSDLDRYVAKL